MPSRIQMYILEPTPRLFVCSLQQFPSEEEAPGVKSFSSVGTGGARAVKGRVGNAWGWPVRYWGSIHDCQGAREKGTTLGGEVTQDPGKERKQNAGPRRRAAQVRHWRRKGAAPRDPVQPQRRPRWGCVWVCPRRGVLREGLARGRAHELCSPEPKGWKVAQCLEGRWGGAAGRPRSCLQPRRGPGLFGIGWWGRGAGPEPRQGAAPTSGGGNGPEWAGTPSRK